MTFYLKAPASHTGARTTDPQPATLSAAALQGNGDIQLAFTLGVALGGHDTITVLRRIPGAGSWTVHASGQSVTSPYTVLAASVTEGMTYDWAIAGVKGTRIAGPSNAIPAASLPNSPYILVTLPTVYLEGGALDPADITHVNIYYGTTSGLLNNLSEIAGNAGGVIGVVTGANPETWYFAAEIIADDGTGVFQSAWSDEVSLSLSGGGTVNVEVITI